MAQESKSAKPAATADKKPKPKAAKGARESKEALAEQELKLEAAAQQEGEEAARAGEEEQEAGKAAPAPKKQAGAEKPAKPAKGKKGEKPHAKGRPRPVLDASLKQALALRTAKDASRPAFRRQEWFRYQRLGEKWRAPGGIQSKMRRHWGTHADVVSIGYRGPRAARGLHPSGFAEVLVHNAEGLKGVDPAKQAVRIAGSVGTRKRRQIQDDAKKMGIRVLNWRDL